MGLAHEDRLADRWYPRPGWSPTSRYLAWHLLPDHAPALQAAVSGYQRVLAGLDGITLVPPWWLHLTVQAVGFADQFDAAQVTALVDAAGRRLAALPPVAPKPPRPPG